MDDKLLKEFRELKVKLKRNYTKDGRAPIVCSDEALIELARLTPRHEDEMTCIPGLGEMFVEKYGAEFMKVLNKYHQNNQSVVTIENSVMATLKNLEQRLVNINKRNRLLYVGKLYNRYTFDLCNENFDNNCNVLDLIFGKNAY